MALGTPATDGEHSAAPLLLLPTSADRITVKPNI
jgi:hypothetical protein